MTIDRIHAKQILMGFVNYVKFFWGIGWRTALLSIIAAIFAGVALGAVSAANSWPPKAIETIAPHLGMPITVSILGYFIVRQSLRSLRKKPASI